MRPSAHRSRGGTVLVGAHLPPDFQRELHMLSAELSHRDGRGKVTIHQLVEEGLVLLLKQHGRTVAKSKATPD